MPFPERAISEVNKKVVRFFVKVLSSLVLVIVLSAFLLALHGDCLVVPAANITVMTRNLYAGASFSIFLGMSTPNDVPDRVDKVYAKILSSRFPWRAEAIADEIVQNQPDVVGLQEAPLLLVQPPSIPLLQISRCKKHPTSLTPSF